MNYIKDSFLKLKQYCETESFQGWDPYDGLNSRIFQRTPFKNYKIFRVFWTQLFKNSPVNLRRIFLVPKEFNPKALALFLSGYANLYKIYKQDEDKDKILCLSNVLLKLQSNGYKAACWGYNFDWQSRSFFIPKFTPNVIVSTFAGNAFLDLYELEPDSKYLDIAKSVTEFILNDLQRSPDQDNEFCFSYSPADKSRIFNVSLLASAFLARVYYFSKKEKLKEEAKASIRFCLRHQNSDGSWFYGLDNNQKWIDSFHTGYNLEALYNYQRYTQDQSFAGSFAKGLNFYLNNFFTDEGLCKYYHNRLYSLDLHCPAQLIRLMSITGKLDEYADLIGRVLQQAIKKLQDKKGFFYYQAKKYYTIKIAYMRWSEAWMFYALSCCLKGNPPVTKRA